MPGGGVGKKKACRGGVCLLTWHRSVGVVTNHSDCGNSDYTGQSGESKVD